MLLSPTSKEIVDWVNTNQGVVGVGIFVTTLFLGWISGIFAALRRKPRFRMSILKGPTFCCSFLTGATQDGKEVHRSAFAIYLHITNIGSSSGSIDEVHVGYHWAIKPFSIQWLRYGIGWFWIKQQTTVVEDFKAAIGENIKVYPFLFQRSILSGMSADTFLQIGQSTNGVVYFEQSDSWGACFPAIEDDSAKVKIRIIDAFGRKHSRKFTIPSVTPDEAQKYNPSFGLTFAHLRGEIRQDDVEQNPEGV